MFRIASTLLVLAFLAACNADPGAGPVAGGGGPGGTDGGGGDCLLRDPVTGLCIAGPGTDLPEHTCTAVAPAGSVATASESGLICGLSDLVCSVENAAAAVDARFDTFATLHYVLGALDPALGGSVGLGVQLPGSVAPGNVAAFLVEFPGGVVDLSLLRTLHVATTLNASAQEEASFDSLLALDVLGLVPGTGRVLVGFRNTAPYNGLTLTVDALLATLDVTAAVRVHEACVGARAG